MAFFNETIFNQISKDIDSDVRGAVKKITPLLKFLETHDYRLHINLQDYFTRNSFRTTIGYIYSLINTPSQMKICFFVAETDEGKISTMYLGIEIPLTQNQEQIIITRLKNVNMNYITAKVAKLITA